MTQEHQNQRIHVNQLITKSVTLKDRKFEQLFCNISYSCCLQKTSFCNCVYGIFSGLSSIMNHILELSRDWLVTGGS